MIDILLVDDHTIFRSGLRRLISDKPDLRVAAEAASSAEALSSIRDRDFDLVILDINLNGRSGFEVLEGVRRTKPHLPVLVMSMYPEEQFGTAAIRAGAHGYITKDVTPEALFNAIHNVLTGRRYLSQTASPIERCADQQPPHYRLSARELQILQYIVNGKSLTEIGRLTFISVKTVSTYRSRILEKLNLTTNAQLIEYAIRFGVGTAP
ncbi:MAG TPA: response regulator transcription factor [Paraburkholderia sp.]|uniref:response regulator transcription factor n=1 Tax=Paraburkholderia sp. TaxID=1926495 RepID=UPI002B493798|nr:response regulator transcription factor [Paraburkholderia sp.]HKR40737.1 response regulator transcription factor [Paraburkholderia sp.]